MIKNFVFDLGNVLFKFDSKEIVIRFNNGKYSEHLHQIIFSNWYKFDSGELNNETFLDYIKNDLNGDEYQVAKTLLDNWIDHLKYDQRVIDVIKKLKKDNFKIYAISNIPIDFVNRFKTIKELDDIEDVIFSSIEHLMKPNKRIFKRAITKFKINPIETIYIDDYKENVDSAILCGFKGIVYKNNIDEIYEMIKGGRWNGF